MKKYTVIDGHVHLYTPGALSALREYRQKAGLRALSLASIGCRADGCAAEQNLLALALKAQEASFFAYGSLLYPSLPVPDNPEGPWDFRSQAEALIAAGFDGVKLLESKPGYRKKLGLPLDAPAYDGFFGYLEREHIPVLWHVADPETFWDAATAPKFAVENHWVYTDGTYPTQQALYDEVYAVLRRHPRLCVSFAHFFFLSMFPDKARALLDAFPNVWLDLTPGIEMYENFSLDPESWRAFFIAYQDRLLLGTDNEDQVPLDDAVITVQNILRFLSTSDAFTFWQSPVRGLHLPDAAVQAIARDNFVRRNGEKPRPVDRQAMRALFDRWLGYVRDPEMRATLEAVYSGHKG